MKNPNTYEHAGHIHAKQTGELIRQDACRHFRNIETANQLKPSIRAGEYASLGAYRLFFITSDGASLSFASVRENFCAVLDSVKTECAEGWRVVAITGEHETDETVFWDHSGEQIS